VDFGHLDLALSVDWVANSTPTGERVGVHIPPRGMVVIMSEQHGHLEGNDEAVQAHLKRLRRIEGQVRGIQRMVEEEKYCIDILTQVSAATKALQALALSLLDDHMAHCLVDAARQGGAEQEQKLKEASEAIARLVKS
jgi:DNA-binding FrmR family transcriptional regulator